MTFLWRHSFYTWCPLSFAHESAIECMHLGNVHLFFLKKASGVWILLLRPLHVLEVISIFFLSGRIINNSINFTRKLHFETLFVVLAGLLWSAWKCIIKNKMNFLNDHAMAYQMKSLIPCWSCLSLTVSYPKSSGSLTSGWLPRFPLQGLLHNAYSDKCAFSASRSLLSQGFSRALYWITWLKTGFLRIEIFSRSCCAPWQHRKRLQKTAT